jgi:hypothetical protein
MGPPKRCFWLKLHGGTLAKGTIEEAAEKCLPFGTVCRVSGIELRPIPQKDEWDVFYSLEVVE